MKRGFRKLRGSLAAALVAASILSASGQTRPSGNSSPAQPAPSPAANPVPPQKDIKITPAQAKELFRSVSEILSFASDDTKLPIERDVKRRLISRDQVQKYILDKFHDDKDAKRMERDEIVLKKFGLLDQDFHLEPFLVSLLTEQILAFYDNKTKTVNLLDWVAPDDQKSVMAHELTHALQDQHTDLDKWEPDEPDSPPKDVNEDNSRLATDERSTARDAVLEGQAMAVYVAYALKHQPPKEEADNSPVMARAPLLLQESLLFPYRDGLEFEQTLLKDKGPQYAFAGALDRPPSTSYEILNPRAYERRQSVPLLHMPDLHPLLDAKYEPYDIGVMGQLDVRMLVELFGGKDKAAVLTPQWNGGLYYAVQSKSAKTPEQESSTSSIGLLYLSAWRTEAAAIDFAQIYGSEMSKKYSKVERDAADETSSDEQIYKTNEGPVLIVRQGKQVFAGEGFDLDLARKLQFLLFGAQQDKDTLIVAGKTPAANNANDPTASLVHFMADCGMMKSALLH